MNLRPHIAISMLLACAFSGAAAQHPPERDIAIDSVVVTAPRKMTDIGAQKTSIAEGILHESVVASMADILALNTPLFIKSYGRATLSTVSTRGTAASHTQVTWNGVCINSPMLGMVDFSYIPSILIDEAAVYYGATSTGVTGGGLGGAVALGTKAAGTDGIGLSYTQGISSYRTFDQFLKVRYGKGRFSGSTRAVYTTSRNDFPYTNYNRKEFVTDGSGGFVDMGYPTERNRNASYRDLHILQELAYDAGRTGRFGLAAWYMDSARGIPLLKVDYYDESRKFARQYENTLRVVADWERISQSMKLGARAGYLYTDLFYLERFDYGTGRTIDPTRSQSYINTAFGELYGDMAAGRKWMFSAKLALHQHFVKTYDEAYVPAYYGDPSGYNQARAELSGFVSASYKPTESLGLAVNLREEIYGGEWSAPMPALFLDWSPGGRGNIVLKASATRNHRFPTLNDLYLKTPGEDMKPRDLRPERGFTYDAGAELRLGREGLTAGGGITLFDSYIADWILWRPTGGAFFTPVNIKSVHSYGVEARAEMSVTFGKWRLALDAKLSYTRSINNGAPLGDDDNSVGKQLPYIPVWSSAVTGRLTRGGWSLTYKWNYYSERYTMTDNSLTITGRLLPYFMNDLSLGYTFSPRWADIELRLAVNNLFDEEYESELSRPMPPRNYGFFVTITPKFKNKP